MRLARRISFFVVLILGLTVQALPAQAQAVIDLGRIPTCRDCVLKPRLLVTLGEASGDGIIEKNHAEVRYSPGAGLYALFHVGGSRILLFDSSGKFVRSVGRQGRGPGEMETLIDAHFSGSNIVALEYGGPKLMVMDRLGRVSREIRLTARPGRFHMVSDTTLVVGSMERTPAAVGYPLHLVRLATGQTLRHFGSTDGQWSAAHPFAQKIVLGRSPAPERIWSGNPARYRFEQWQVDGQLLRTVSGEPDWFPGRVNQDRDAGPPTLLVDFGVDAADRLWTVVQVPDPDWREVPKRGREGYVLTEDEDGFFDTRIDVFDLRGRRHLGTLRWDEAFVSLVQIGGGLTLQKVSYDSDGVPRVAVYGLDLTSP